MNNTKLTRTAGTLDRITGAAAGILRAAGIVCAVFAVLVPVFGSRIFAAGSLTLDLDFVRLHLAERYQSITPAVKLYAMVNLITAGTLCFTAAFALSVLRKILAPMKEARPFEAGVPENLKKIAWIVLFGGAAAEIFGIIGRVLLVSAYPIGEILASDAITGMEYSFSMDLSFVLVAGVFFFLSYIFRYGQDLQQESDETL